MSILLLTGLPLFVLGLLLLINPSVVMGADTSVGSVGPTLAQIAKNDTVDTEGTAMSQHDQLPGHYMHQAVVILPVRSDHKLWVGTVSWTASKPIEIRLLYDYNTSLTTDAAHGQPVTAPLGFTAENPPVAIGRVGISLIKVFQGPPVVSSFDSGSLPFVAKGVAFHSVNGTKFTVNYAVDAVAKPMNR
jgi:hypothetical protein